jgi:hypothetical protein
MPAPSLKKEMLLEAGWLRELCSEAMSASCPSCGSPIDLASGDSSVAEKECWVCTWKGTPIYQCAKCSQPCESLSGAERECQSVSAFENRALVAFQPEGEVWFHKKSASGKIRCTLEANLLDALTSGELKPTTLVCNHGADSFEKANEHSKFSGILAPSEPPPIPILPTATPEPPPLPELGHSPVQNNFVAILLALIFGPVGLLYISWKVSFVTLLLHITACWMLGWPKWAVITFWHIVPFLLAYWITRRITSASDLIRGIIQDTLSCYRIACTIAMSSAGAFASAAIFLSGFLYAGQLLKNSSWITIFLFSIFCIYCTVLSFRIAKKYTESLTTGSTVYFPYPLLECSDSLKNWLRWLAVGTMGYMTLLNWEQNPGLPRLALIAATISVPFIPVFRSAAGTFAFGALAGLASLLISAIASGLVFFIYRLIMK